jgi:hypothetical protein
MTVNRIRKKLTQTMDLKTEGAEKAHRAQEQGFSVSFGKSLAFCFQ